MPKVSIILPNYNYAQYLTQRIESILNQSFKDFELIILDDYSTDNSKDIIEKYKKNDNRISVYYNKRNTGNPFVQWKKGIELAKNNLIWIAEADDYCETNFLDKLLPAFENENTGIVFCKSKLINQNGNEIDITNSTLNNSKFENNFVEKGQDFTNNFLVEYNFIPNASAVIFRKDIYKKAGGIDIEIKNCSDWLLWLKMLQFCNVSFIAEPLNYFRRHPNSVIGKISSQKNAFTESYSKTMRLFFKKWLKKNNFKLNKNANFINNYEISLDIGNYGLFCIKNKKFILGIINILKASFFPKPKSYFLKKMFSLK